MDDQLQELGDFGFLTDLRRIINVKLCICQMQFESTTETDEGAMLDSSQSVRTRRIDAAEAHQTLRIELHLAKSPVILSIDSSGLIRDTHEGRAETVSVRES